MLEASKEGDEGKINEGRFIAQDESATRAARIARRVQADPVKLHDGEGEPALIYEQGQRSCYYPFNQTQSIVPLKLPLPSTTSFLLVLRRSIDPAAPSNSVV